MFNTNGAKALIGVCVITIVFLGLTLALGVGEQVQAEDMAVNGLINNYFERMPDDLYRVTAETLASLIEFNKDGLYIVDIRDAKDYEIQHIEGAINIPFKEIGSKVSTFPKDKLIVVYCYTGQNGGQVVSLLNIAGYKAKSLSGGYNNGWMIAFVQNTASAEVPPSCS